MCLFQLQQPCGGLKKVYDSIVGICSITMYDIKLAHFAKYSMWGNVFLKT